MLEKDIQKTIIEYLEYKKVLVFRHQNVGVFKKDSGQFVSYGAKKGIADIIGCLKNGQFFAIEVKGPKGVVSPEQQEFLSRVRDNEGMAFVARSLEDVVKYIQ